MDNDSNKIDGLHIKLDNLALRIEERFDKIEGTQIEQAKDICHHIERTDELQDIVEPLYNKYQQILGVVKFIAFFAVLGGSIGTIKLIISYLSQR